MIRRCCEMKAGVVAGWFLWAANAVAAALNAFEWVIPHRAGGGTADMAALCGGAIDVFITKIVGAPAEVNIVAIVGEKQFVKNTKFMPNDSVQCCTATDHRRNGNPPPSGIC